MKWISFRPLLSPSSPILIRDLSRSADNRPHSSDARFGWELPFRREQHNNMFRIHKKEIWSKISLPMGAERVFLPRYVCNGRFGQNNATVFMWRWAGERILPLLFSNGRSFPLLPPILFFFFFSFRYRVWFYGPIILRSSPFFCRSSRVEIHPFSAFRMLGSHITIVQFTRRAIQSKYSKFWRISP